ncbi:hypothetical protein A2890_01425 [candidate division WWE3 bacterium RIFCSPLOWO2_01_FULL_53_14]|uniref:histidine kinase n=1 Tax=candidate division WWE3 bacterium RIFCSPLOWO2_01_FULL_53_14 TaxID=1802628 RepID=A0A1F4VYY4_UNCKA|nr:MAG: hypothetical protein A2890_01425 [candidate division WWE3 bacterium RIFCSPLOWO2_01_FULL_53_14]
MFLFAYSLKEKYRVSLNKKLFLGLLVLLVLNTILALSSLSVEGVEFSGGGVGPVRGPLYQLMQAFTITLALWGLVKIASFYRKSKGLDKLQLQYLGIGLGLFTLSGIFVSVVLPQFEIFRFRSLTSSFQILMTIPVTYAILRYRLFDIRIALQSGIAMLLIAATGPSMYFFILRIVELAAPERVNSLTPFVVAATVIVMFLAGIQAVRIFQRVTERFFFRGTYLYVETLRKITGVLNRATSVGDFGTKLTRTIAEIFKTKKAAFLLWDEKRNIFVPIYAQTLSDREILTFPRDHVLIQLMEKSDGPLLTEEMAERTPSVEQIENLKRSGLAICSPIRVRGKIEAFLCLGEKGSGDPYTTRDTSLLEAVSHESGVALENAKLYTSLDEKVRERTRSLREVQKQELEKARDVARLKDEFFFIATHELRTPATAIGGFLSLVSEAKEKFPRDIRENLDFMSQANDHLKQLINDLLEISREEAGNLVTKTEPHDFSPILAEVANEVLPMARERGIKLSADITVAPQILCDPGKLKEVLMNLVTNAIKYNRDKGTVSISAFRQPGEDSLIVEVRDTGYGIPEEVQKKIFQKFFRVGAKETQDVLGTGLGLFITRMLVEKMGGKIRFSSVKGEGSTFTFSLPLAQGKSKKDKLPK